MIRYAIGVILVLQPAIASSADAFKAPRVYRKGERPNDTRLGPLRGERGDFSLKPAKSIEQWKARRKRVRRIMLVAMGLWPMPEKTPLKPVIHGKSTHGDYTIEKVYFQSLPGFYVTGSLYRPVKAKGRRPAVLSPHGHFPGGRFIDEGREAVRWKIAKGAERFEEGGRSFMQSRCVQLARMGCIVFHYDMIGYGDCMRLSQHAVHRFSRTRLKHPKPPNAGFYSPTAELWLQNPLGLHTWNSIRALDFLCGLPDVDSKRVAVTGGSGGGTQTFMLCAVDDRPLVSVPVVILSADRQGGCTCENISDFRIGTFNLEFAAMHAPKPMLIVSADDASRTMPKRGFPELQQHYQVLKAPKNVAHVPLLHFPHNYNAVSRTAMYHWVNRHLKLGLKEPILERPYKRLSRQKLTVWNKQHPRPAGGRAFELKLLASMRKSSERRIEVMKPAERLKMLREAWEILLRKPPRDAGLKYTSRGSSVHPGYRQSIGLLNYRTPERHTAELPIVRLTPAKEKRRVVVVLHKRGKSGLFGSDGKPTRDVKRLLRAGIEVVSVDLFQQGEFLKDGKPIRRQRFLQGESGHAGWTYCYNLPLFAKRVHDVIAVLRHLRVDHPKAGIDIVGIIGTGHWAAAAVALAPKGTVNAAAIDTGGFRFAKLDDVYHPDFVPGAAKYRDLPALLSLANSRSLWLAGEGVKPPRLVVDGWKSRRLAIARSGDRMAVSKAAIDWIRKRKP